MNNINKQISAVVMTSVSIDQMADVEIVECMGTIAFNLYCATTYHSYRGEFYVLLETV